MIASGRKALILSPSASHPQDYGNRNRVFQTTTRLKNAGFDIHFVLYPYESDWVHGMPDSADDIRKAWSSFTVIPPSKTLHAPPEGPHHLIDEWWDPQIGSYLEWLFAREAFDVFVVNYTFLSKAFDLAPKSTVKVLETHDIFSGRKELFLAHGAEPEFFYTTRDQEKLALDRADIVVAIKDGEAEHLRTLTNRTVVSVPFDVVERPVTRRPERLENTEALKVGFIGALNTVNSLNMARFLDAFAKFERIYVPPPIEIHIAGNVCSKLKATSKNVKLLGHVPSVEEYYDTIDAVVAPMSFSTGIKIKVGEALSFGKPVISTHNGFDGFPSTDEYHALKDIPEVCRALMKLAFDRDRLTALEDHTAFAARLARRRSASGYAALFDAIRKMSKAIVFVTDRALWKPASFEEERLTQWAEFCAFMARTTIVYVGQEPVGTFSGRSRQFTRNAKVTPVETADGALRVIEELAGTHALADVVVTAGNGTGREIWNGVSEQSECLALDLWVEELAEIAGPASITERGDVWMVSNTAAASSRRAVSTTALRYLPESLRSWAGAERSLEILVVLCGPDESDLRGVETLQARFAPTAANTRQLSIAVASSEDLLSDLAERRGPAILLAVGRDLRLAEVCRSVAACADIPFLHISSEQLPFAMVGQDGLPELCASFADVADQLPTLLADRPLSAPEHPRDTGWSTYWRHMTET
jgi:glycosyltransferase involved in cell wall biosynthesis